MKSLVFSQTHFETIRKTLLASDVESCAVLIATSHSREDITRYLVKDVYYAGPDDYSKQTGTRATLTVEFMLPAIQRARKEGASLVFVHTHPGAQGAPHFSVIDDQGEAHLKPAIARLCDGQEHFALVLSDSGESARVLGATEQIPIEVIGTNYIGRSQLTEPEQNLSGDERWDRQLRIFGSSGQNTIRNLRVSIVGAGGTGSIVAQELAYLGVELIRLIDPDQIEVTNLNRVLGAGSMDVGHPKVSVIGNSLRTLSFGTKIEEIEGDVRDQPTQTLLTDSDIIFCCTDSHGSRAIINQIAYQYFIPVFDVGVSIGAIEGKTSHIAGRVQMLTPGLGCLVCSQALDWAEVRRDLLSDEDRRADPYIIGHREPQPAVISLNGTLSSLAVTMFISAVTATGGNARLQFYNGLAGTLRSAAVRPQPSCVVCSPSGALAHGDAWPIPSRVQ